jgi:predicted transcriptional regulator
MAEAWQIQDIEQDIEQGIAEANQGAFASADEVNSLFAEYGG